MDLIASRRRPGIEADRDLTAHAAEATQRQLEPVHRLARRDGAVDPAEPAALRIVSSNAVPSDRHEPEVEHTVGLGDCLPDGRQALVNGPPELHHGALDRLRDAISIRVHRHDAADCGRRAFGEADHQLAALIGQIEVLADGLLTVEAVVRHHHEAADALRQVLEMRDALIVHPALLGWIGAAAEPPIVRDPTDATFRVDPRTAVEDGGDHIDDLAGLGLGLGTRRQAHSTAKHHRDIGDVAVVADRGDGLAEPPLPQSRQHIVGSGLEPADREASAAIRLRLKRRVEAVYGNARAGNGDAVAVDHGALDPPGSGHQIEIDNDLLTGRGQLRRALGILAGCGVLRPQGVAAERQVRQDIGAVDVGHRVPPEVLRDDVRSLNRCPHSGIASVHRAAHRPQLLLGDQDLHRVGGIAEQLDQLLCNVATCCRVPDLERHDTGWQIGHHEPAVSVGRRHVDGPASAARDHEHLHASHRSRRSAVDDCPVNLGWRRGARALNHQLDLGLLAGPRHLGRRVHELIAIASDELHRPDRQVLQPERAVRSRDDTGALDGKAHRPCGDPRVHQRRAVRARHRADHIAPSQHDHRQLPDVAIACKPRRKACIPSGGRIDRSHQKGGVAVRYRVVPETDRVEDIRAGRVRDHDIRAGKEPPIQSRGVLHLRRLIQLDGGAGYRLAVAADHQTSHRAGRHLSDHLDGLVDQHHLAAADDRDAANPGTQR